MSMDEPPAILLRRCKERSGIRLTREYLTAWNQRRSSSTPNIESAYTDIVADFLKTDISETSEPVIPEDYGRLAIDTFPPAHLRQGGGVVLQIQDTNDVSHSALSQLDNLSSGQTWPRGKLRWTLSDGHLQVQATEFQPIPFLNLTIPFGSKVLVKSCQVRRGMLMLTPDNVKWLGGGVPELYGGNMTTELQTRLKTRLGTLAQPNTPIPSTTPSNSFTNSFTANRNTTTTNYPTPSSRSSTNSTPFVNTMHSSHTNNNASASEFDEFGDIDMDQFNDMDMSQFNDIDMDQFNDIDLDDEFGYDEDMDEVSEPTISQIIPPAPPASTATVPSFDDSDDDFVSTQIIPVKSRLQPKSPVSLAKRPRINPPAVRTNSAEARGRTSEEPSVIRAPKERVSSAETFTSTMDQGSIPSIKKEKNPVEEEVHWVDPSAWMEEEEEEEEEKIEGVEVRSDGKTYVTFEALHRIIGQMEQNTFTGSLVDVVIVEARYRKIAAMRLSDASGFYSIFEIGDPLDEKSDKIIKIVIGNSLFMEFLGIDPKDAKTVGDELKDVKKARKVRWVHFTHFFFFCLC
ncbi:uncharacterized protein EV154DRAFT_147928 [Mucor mucedo]|uniref:uncharacterized protein n=1 Tax=Mucor mucedo TaxID=29922 RepID=UPI00221F3A72|nr:uncharacterized protein EV154DRAFT_147928 [Mucor mucedo]KAI7867088.1 hypothetical protein EV154DRAFT_147928 [Mucor mucedo]